MTWKYSESYTGCVNIKPTVRTGMRTMRKPAAAALAVSVLTKMGSVAVAS